MLSYNAILIDIILIVHLIVHPDFPKRPFSIRKHTIVALYKSINCCDTKHLHH